MQKLEERLFRNSAEKLSIRETLNWFLIVMVVVFSCVSLNFYARENSKKLDEQREYELIKISNHTSHHFQNFLENKLEWLRMFALAAGMSEYEEKEDWIELAKTMHSDDYQMGIAGASGIVYYGDYEQKDVRKQEYFIRAMNGENYISKINKKELHENDSIILSVPIQNLMGEIEGIVAMEYSTMKLGEYINHINEDWDEYGANMIINAKGEIVASYEGMEKYDTIYDMLSEMQLEDGASLEKMKEDTVNGKSGIFRYYNHDTRRMLYYQPLGINDWTMVSVGAMKNNLVILQSIEKNNLIFSVVFALIILSGVIATKNIYHCRTKRIKDMKLDNLTGIYRREIGEEIVKSIFEHGKNIRIYGCIFIDVDDFKQINDTYGHEKGDEVLASLGEILLENSRKEDIVYRYGGDELCIWLCGNSTKEEITEIGNRIITKVGEKGIVHLSIGATFVRKDDSDWQEVLRRADEAVYEAKKRGKNQIVLYEETA